MFDSLLIANRGEIACRIIRTARRMGIRTIAVFSEADAGALHVEMADQAFLIGPAPAAESYLRADKILECARETGASAIHPGYGFLSENAAFAESCADAGIVFVGPPPAAIRAMGVKSEAKSLMEQAGLPVLPGYHGEKQDLARLRKAAEGIGYPVLIKAVSGGGGKGMRLVEKPAEFAAALEGAQREARSSFGDDRVLIEKFLRIPRHIEIQVFADGLGNVVHLFERDCSLQRRHQKVVEESPAPGMTPELRDQMGTAAVEATRAIGYRGAGTVEFIVDVAEGLDGAPFYFMEMNTRLQVEHPVTELITGLDLVEWQLRVAAGEPLPSAQEDLAIHGHAVEARIYAENPGRDFLPATGRLLKMRTAKPGPHVRIDSGVREGDTVSVHYDPMIAKLISWDLDRGAALGRLRAALAEFRIAGLDNNIAFLSGIVRHDAFMNGDIDTGFIANHKADLAPPAEPVSDTILALACLDVLLTRREEVADLSAASQDIWSPWRSVHAWRLNDRGFDVLRFVDGDSEIEVRVCYDGNNSVLELPGARITACAEREDSGDLIADLSGRRISATIVHQDAEITVMTEGASHKLLQSDPRLDIHDEDEASDVIIAPMPGKIIKVVAKPGDYVEKGDALLILEAMKMEHTIAAAAPGKIATVAVAISDQVEEGNVLVTFDPPDEADK
ncbi:MAG: acetyl/propionyl/methylcrotonyl-CoA carboxylase subunit alpha [Sphingomonadales bacterium]